MAERINPNTITWETPQKEALETRGKEVGIRSGELTAEEKAATLPYAKPSAEAELTSRRLGSVRELNTALRDETKAFNDLEEVKVYKQGMRYFTAALNTPENAAGDQDLVTLAAKVQDPTGAVMQGDIERYNNIQVAKERLPQLFRNEFDNSGKFSATTRKQIREFLKSRLDVYRDSYISARGQTVDRLNAFNTDVQQAGMKPFDVNTVVGQDPYEIYRPRIETYEKRQRIADIKAGIPPEERRADIFLGRPEGSVAPEPFKAPRLSADATAEITDYSRSAPDFTPEGYARLVAEKMKNEGLITPDQEQATYEKNLIAAQEYFKNFKTPEQRQTIPPGLDYSEADKATAERAGLTQTIGAALSPSTLATSAIDLATSPLIIPVDALKSVLTKERVGTIKAFPDLAVELVKQAGGDPTGPMTQQFSKMLEENYGSVGAWKKRFAQDPLAVIGDLSVIATAGGTAAARLPGAAGKVGRMVETAGRVMDPLSAIVGAGEIIGPGAYRMAREKAPGVVTGAQNIPSNLMGMPSAVGGETIREGAAAGFGRSMAGADTPEASAFLRNLRNPSENVDSVVKVSLDAIRNMKDRSYQQYLAGMQTLDRNPIPLNLDSVRQAVLNAKPAMYDQFVGKDVRPPSHKAWDQMNSAVEGYLADAQSNPALLMPRAVDEFKQVVYDIGKTLPGGQTDSDIRGIARAAYNGIKDVIVRHDPDYAKVMKDSEEALSNVRELEETFALKPGKEGRVNIDNATRRLQSIFRNNANTNYGRRAVLGEQLAEADISGELMPSLAGQMASSPQPRGLQGLVPAAGGAIGGVTALQQLLSGTGSPLTTLGLTALGAGLTSPRLAGEAAYYMGRGAGMGAKGVRSLYDLYQKYPASTLALGQVSAMGEQAAETDAARRPPAPNVLELAQSPEAITVTATRPQIVDEDEENYILSDGTKLPKSLAARPIPKAKGGKVSKRLACR